MSEERNYSVEAFFNVRFGNLMDRLEKFLDKSDGQKSDLSDCVPLGGSVINEPPEEPPHPEALDKVLGEMATGGLITVKQMRRIVNAMRPILKENAKLKAASCKKKKK